jgi:predicted phage-related endonuclease
MPWNSLAEKEPFSDAEQAAALARWLDERCGCLTASRMADAMDFLKNGNPSAKRKNYMTDLLAERLTSVSTRHYVTPAMQWGMDTEAEAKLVYQEMTGHELLPAEFILHPTIGNFGATPDGFIGKDGLLEVKCPTTATFVEWRLAGVVPEEHQPQMTVQLLCSDREWVDFFAYDPRIKDRKLNHFLRRFVPPDSLVREVTEHAMRFLDELDDLFDRFVTA